MQFIKIDKEFQNILRPLTAEEFKSLENDIKENGCLRPVELWNGYIADGHNRYTICMKNGIPFEQADVTEKFETKSDVMKWIVQNQRARQTGRQLTKTELVEMAIAIEKQIAVEAKENQGARTDISSNLKKSKEPIVSAKQAAESIGVSENTYRDMKLVTEKGSEEQIERMNKGGRGNAPSAIAKEIKEKNIPLIKCSKCGNEYPATYFDKGGRQCKYCREPIRHQKQLRDVKGDLIVNTGEYDSISDEDMIGNLYVNDVNVSIKDVIDEFYVNLESYLNNLERILNSHRDLIENHKPEITDMWNEATNKFKEVKEKYA